MSERAETAPASQPGDDPAVRVPEALAANATGQKILRGAIEALGRRGSRSLSMSDVASAANVSRATLYRYFPTKGAVLEAVSEYISNAFLRGAAAIARDVTDPFERLQAVMSLQAQLAGEEFITRITEVEPSLVLKFLADHYKRHADAVRRVLDPLFDTIEARAGIEVDREMLAALVLRVQLSLVIVPPDTRWRSAPGALVQMLTDSMRGAAGRPLARARARRRATAV